MRPTQIRACRICGSPVLTKVIDLGAQYLQGLFVKPGKENPPSFKIPLSLVLCDQAKNKKACGLLQMEYTVPSKVLYSTYWYRSGINDTMRNHLHDIADKAAALVAKPSACVLDIGCNDGTLLNYYHDNFQKWGVDPSDAVGEIQDNINVVHDFFPSKELTKLLQGRKFDIITSIAMFYDLKDPARFVRALKTMLAPNGVWIFEMQYMPTMLKMNTYDVICCEHLEYYSLAVIEYILKQSEMKIFNISYSDINGGSLCCYSTHANNTAYDRNDFEKNIDKLRNKESEMALYSDKPYKDFQRRINAHKEELSSLLKKLKSKGKKIHVYGASTKGNTILQWCEINNKIIDFAAERNPDKFGAFTLGTNIPIISEAESRAKNPDYYLVLPWHFKQEIIEREQTMLNKGVGFIFPLPNIEIVTK